MKVKAVIFDLFKTLGEFKRLITDEEVSTLLRSRGYEVYPQTWRHAFSFVVFIDYPKKGYSSHEALFNQVFRRLEVEVDKDTISELSVKFRDSPFVLYSESSEAVKRAKDVGLKTAIATSTPKPFFMSGIKPLEKYFDFICTGYEAGYEKSNPQIYEKILDKLRVKTVETVVIGDNPILDVTNPKQLGMRAIQITNEEITKSGDEFAKNVLEAVNKLMEWK